MECSCSSPRGLFVVYTVRSNGNKAKFDFIREGGLARSDARLRRQLGDIKHIVTRINRALGGGGMGTGVTSLETVVSSPRYPRASLPSFLPSSLRQRGERWDGRAKVTAQPLRGPLDGFVLFLRTPVADSAENYTTRLRLRPPLLLLLTYRHFSLTLHFPYRIFTPSPPHLRLESLKKKERTTQGIKTFNTQGSPNRKKSVHVHR